jgi:uncharacterized membrane protein
MTGAARHPKLVAGLRGLLGVAMIVAGVLHFVIPHYYMLIMPAYLPWHLALVLISGVFEIGLGLALFVPRLRPIAGWGLIALLVAVWPANIWMATDGVPGVDISPVLAWVRVAVQPLFMVWAWAVSRPD